MLAAAEKLRCSPSVRSSLPALWPYGGRIIHLCICATHSVPLFCFPASSPGEAFDNPAEPTGLYHEMRIRGTPSCRPQVTFNVPVAPLPTVQLREGGCGRTEARSWPIHPLSWAWLVCVHL
jgi:hypothetical protein